MPASNRLESGIQFAAKSQQVMQAVLKMVKLDIRKLKDAYEGK